MQRLIAHREQKPAALSAFEDLSVSPEFDAVVQKMLSKHPEDRYQEMGEVVADLRALAQGKKPSVEPYVPNPQSRHSTLPANPAPASSPLGIQLDDDSSSVSASLAKNVWTKARFGNDPRR